MSKRYSPKKAEDRDVTPKKRQPSTGIMQYAPTKSNPALHDKMIFKHLGKRNYGEKI